MVEALLAPVAFVVIGVVVVVIVGISLLRRRARGQGIPGDASSQTTDPGAESREPRRRTG